MKNWQKRADTQKVEGKRGEVITHVENEDIFTCHLFGCSQRQKWNIPICMIPMKSSLRKGRTGKVNLSQASLYSLYCVIL